MGKSKGKQFNIEKRAVLSRMVAKGNKNYILQVLI